MIPTQLLRLTDAIRGYLSMPSVRQCWDGLAVLSGPQHRLTNSEIKAFSLSLPLHPVLSIGIQQQPSLLR